MPDVATALDAMPDVQTRARYLRAVLARVAKQADPLLASAMAVALASTPPESLAPDLAPRVGLVISGRHNRTRRPEPAELNGAPISLPAGVANLLREALTFPEFDADRRFYMQLRAMLPEVARHIVEDPDRVGSGPKRGIYRASASLSQSVQIGGQ